MLYNILRFNTICLSASVFISACSLFFSSPAESTIMFKKYTTGEMIDRSDTIVFGKVKDISFEQNNRNQVFTYTTIQCDDILKGNPSLNEFKVIEIGGKTAKYTTAVYGAPTYAINEEVVLFLRTNKYDKRLKRVVALNQGKYSITIDPQTGEKFAVTDLSDIGFVDKKDQESERKLHKIPFEDFMRQIKTGINEENKNTTTQDNYSDTSAIDKKNIIEKFDLVLWIREKIIFYSNKAAKNYKNITYNCRYKGNS